MSNSTDSSFHFKSRLIQERYNLIYWVSGGGKCQSRSSVSQEKAKPNSHYRLFFTEKRKALRKKKFQSLENLLWKRDSLEVRIRSG